jgi:hypothetical protein
MLRSIPEMKKPAPTPSPIPYHNPYNYQYQNYDSGLRYPGRCTSEPSWIWLDGGWWCSDPYVSPCCRRPALVP